MGILDNAKDIANAVHEAKNLDLYARVLELNRGIMDIVEENRNLNIENEELKKKLKFSHLMSFKEPFYYQENDKTPFCPACWELKNLAIHLIFVFNNEDAIRWDCKVCRNTFMDKKDRAVPKQHRNDPTPYTWG